MASKRFGSPVPIDVMKVNGKKKEILKMIAEPNSGNSKKKPDSAYFQHPGKVINHDYCDVCSGGGEIVCCDKCPRSFHIRCHIPSINKLPDGEWFCRSCTGCDDDDIILKIPKNTFEVRARLTRLFEIEYLKKNTEEFLNEVPIQRRYNVKLQGRKQLDKQKMIRKIDRCFLCKRGVLKGRLVNCHYCKKLYHLNCLDIPIRDWDHSMRWICPAHTSFFQLAYPDQYTPGAGVLSDTITMKRKRCELPRLPKDKFFNVPSHIDAIYKEPEENIPTMSTDNSSLNILCDVASLELESINSDQYINHENRISKNISVKFLPATQHLSTLENKNLLPKQPYASLSCLSSFTPMTISIQGKSFTIGKSHNNNLSLQDLGDCEYVSDYHATITFNDKLGDYLVKNHSRHGLIVDNVSYFGNRRPKESSNSELKKINSQVKKFINKRRSQVRHRNLIHVYQNIDGEKVVFKYAGKIRSFNYEPMLKYYMGKLKNTKHSIKKVECKCSKRLPPKDGYAGQALLTNGSIISIGCLTFKFTYDIFTRKMTKSCTENLEAKQDGNKLLNGEQLKLPSEQENCINNTNCIRNEQEIVTINSHCSLENTDDTNSFNEQNNISLLDLHNSQGGSSSKEKAIINGMTKNTTMHKSNIKSPLEVNMSDTVCTKKFNNTDDVLLNKCLASDLIQEVDVLSDDGRVIEEEIVYSMHVPEAEISTTNRINDVQDWIIEEIVVEDKNYNNNDHDSSVNLQLSSPLEYSVPENNHGDYKTEHMYCARSPSYNEPIVISDDDD